MSSHAGTIKCRGGCGRDLDPTVREDGLCRKCEGEAHDRNAEKWRAGH